MNSGALWSVSLRNKCRLFLGAIQQLILGFVALGNETLPAPSWLIPVLLMGISKEILLTNKINVTN
jgi:hypothetical protein